jgi:RsiW-degrading membrane proteinase PrsW (M82 family)
VPPAVARFLKQRTRANPKKESQTMNRNRLYLIIGALAIATVVLSYLYYQERQKTTGIEINVDKSGISIEQK